MEFIICSNFQVILKFVNSLVSDGLHKQNPDARMDTRKNARANTKTRLTAHRKLVRQ